jgi:hypothetical protein
MARYDDTFVDRFLEPWNRHDVDGALALMTDDCVHIAISTPPWGSSRPGFGIIAVVASVEPATSPTARS